MLICTGRYVAALSAEQLNDEEHVSTCSSRSPQRTVSGHSSEAWLSCLPLTSHTVCSHAMRCPTLDKLVRAVKRAVTGSDRWAEQEAYLLAGVYFKAASIYLEHPKYLLKAARLWWSAFVRSPAHWKRLFWLPVVKARWHVRRLLPSSRRSPVSSGLHWSEWA